MAVRTESRVTIAGSVPEVWAYFCDVGRRPHAVEVDRRGLMRAIPGRILRGRIQRVSEREMAAIEAAVESMSTP